MKKGTLYLSQPVAPGNKDWFHFYEVWSHDATGIKVLDGQNHWIFFPAHLIQRIEYD